MEPAVQGACIGALAAISGVITNWFIQKKLKLGEEERRREEVAELTLFYCRRLRLILREFSDKNLMLKYMAVGVSFNDDDISDMDFVLKELASKLPHVNLILFDLRRVIKNIQGYDKKHYEVRNSGKNIKELDIIEAWIVGEAKRGNIEAHRAIQACFSVLSKSRKKTIIKRVSQDKTYRESL
jgi:hypothetical protein